jgi:hypothetical protein
MGAPLVWNFEAKRTCCCSKTIICQISANSNETMSIVESQASIEVTANSGALPGLDNSVAQSGEDSTPEPRKAIG